MKLLFSLSAVVVVAACTSTPKRPAFDSTPYIPQVREGIEFGSNSAVTRRFFTGFMENSDSPEERMERYFEVLGENLSSALLALKDPYADQLSITLNRDMEAFVKAVNRRVFSGGSLVEMQDVMKMEPEGEFVKVHLDAPNILTGTLYIMKEPIEGRTPAEQTFLDYYRPGRETRKLSVSALIGLLRD